MGKVQPRDVTPIIAKLRNLIGGRQIKSVHRFEQDIAPRTPAHEPVLPEGPSHAMSNNWYYNRDGRRQSAPPVSVYSLKAIAAGGEAGAATVTTVPKPGFGYNWTTGEPDYKS